MGIFHKTSSVVFTKAKLFKQQLTAQITREGIGFLETKLFFPLSNLVKISFYVTKIKVILIDSSGRHVCLWLQYQRGLLTLLDSLWWPRQMVYILTFVTTLFFLRGAFPLYSFLWQFFLGLLQIFLMMFFLSRLKKPKAWAMASLGLFTSLLSLLLLHWLPGGVAFFITSVFLWMLYLLIKPSVLWAYKTFFSLFWVLTVFLFWNLVALSIKANWDLLRFPSVSIVIQKIPLWKKVKVHPLSFLLQESTVPFFITPFKIQEVWLPPLSQYGAKIHSPKTQQAFVFILPVEATLEQAVAFTDKYMQTVGHYSWSLLTKEEDFPLSFQGRRGFFFQYRVWDQHGPAVWSFWFLSSLKEGPPTKDPLWVFSVFTRFPEESEYLLNKAVQATLERL